MELDAIDQIILNRMYGAPDVMELVVRVGFARATVLKHLNRPQKEGLVVREKVLPKGRGRPRFIYRLKTEALQSIVPIEIVSLTFQKLKHACRFEKGGWCRESRKTCSSENCPLIVK
jgi:predicted ArsR family transcriptional regulator